MRIEVLDEENMVVFEYWAEAPPRIGETIDYQDTFYEVNDVMHVVQESSGTPPTANKLEYITVKVRDKHND